MATESGFSNEKMLGRSRHKTLQSLGSGRIAAPSAGMGLFALPSGTLTISAVEVSSDRKTITLTVPAHGARQWDLARILTGSLANSELEILSCPSATTLKVHNLGLTEAGLEVLPQIGDTLGVFRWVTSQLGSDGSLQVSVAPTPVQYVQDGVTVSTSKDTVVPANTRSLPVEDSVQALDIATMDFSGVTVNNSAWTQLLAATSGRIRKIQVFMSSGTPLELAFGAPGSEVPRILVLPGGNGFVDLLIPTGTRLSVRAKFVASADFPYPTAGVLLMNLLG